MNNLGYRKKLSKIILPQQQIIIDLFKKLIAHIGCHAPHLTFQAMLSLRGIHISVSKSASGVVGGEFQ